jgi:PAS domain S-box-containing protein
MIVAGAGRRRMEQENREWKRFFDQATFGVVRGFKDGKIGRTNEAFALMHGYTVAELEGAPIAALVAPDHQAEIAGITCVTRACGRRRWESEHVRKDGSVFPVVIDLSAVCDERGEVLYCAAYVQDITREKEDEAARARLVSLVQSAEDAIVAKALDGTVLAWNHGAERIYGYTSAEMIGRPITTIVPEDRRAEREGIRAKVLGGETIAGFETIRVRKDGARIPVSLTLSPIRDPAGRVVGISTIARDITAQKQLEREREEWASVVAHDLRQPATTIRFAAEMLATAEGPTRQKAVERIRRASCRLERMIEDLLDVSRIEAHHLTVRPGPVDLPALIDEALDLAPQVAIRCRTEIAPDAAHALADPGRFLQVLSNLLSNADKYSAPGTPIEIGVERCGGRVKVRVTNEGPGIAPDEIPRLFSRFARTRSARGSAIPGLGLGLYICRGVIEALGGELWVESVPGERTHFHFTLPVVPAGEVRLTA